MWGVIHSVPSKKGYRPMKRVTWIPALTLLFACTLGSARGGNEAAPVDSQTLVSIATTLPSDSGQVVLASVNEEATLAEEPSPAYEEPAPGPAGPWTIPQPHFFQEHGIKTGGWLQQGITFNGWGPADRFNGPITTNDRSGEYMLNQMWVYFVRPTKTDGDGFDIGGRVDVVYGEDWRFGQCVGLETRIDSPNNFYGMVLPQFYLEVAYNDLTVKAGHFATLTSLELVPAPLNFFYSHSYLMAGYFDPLLVTGLQADYKLNDHWTVVGGFHRGWNLFENPFGGLNFLGGLKWTGDEKRSALSAMVDVGPTITFTGFHDQTSVILVFTHQFSERFWSGTQVTVGSESEGSAITPGVGDTWYGFEQLFTYKLNPKWSAGLRYEWIQNDEGSRIAGIGNVLGTNRGWAGKPGYAGSFSDLSLGLNYRPHPNFALRPEIRWDWFNGPANPNDPVYPLPFGDGAHSSQFTTGLDLIFTF
jgi:hypothetical protein